MNKLPRTPKSGIIILAVFFSAVTAHAQQQRVHTKPGGTPVVNQAGARIRSTAINLLFETANAANSFDDLVYRARIQMLAADLLWTSNRVSARAIFLRAWEAATAADDAATKDDENYQLDSVDSAIVPVTESRDQVLSSVAPRDPKLAEIFLEELLKGRSGDAVKTSSNKGRNPWRTLNADGMRRLALAYDLLRRKEASVAMLIALPLISDGPSAELMAFITHLGEQNPQKADTLYLNLLERLASSPDTDVEDVLLVSSSIVSPYMLASMDEQGSLQLRPIARDDAGAKPYLSFSEVSRQAFFVLATRVLLQPPQNGSPSRSDASAVYFTIARLLPSFERGAPQFVPELHARLESLEVNIDPSQRRTLSEQSGIRSEVSARDQDPLGFLAAQLSRTKDTSSRDRLGILIVKLAVRHKLWDRARRAASDIEDSETRRKALSFIALGQIGDIMRAYKGNHDGYEDILKFVRSADLPPIAVAWGTAEAAAIASRSGKRLRAANLLDEAEAIMAREESATEQKVAGYSLLVNVSANLNAKRAWKFLFELVHVSNEIESFPGDDFFLEIDRAGNSESETAFSMDDEVFRLDGAFKAMAHLDFDKALVNARGMTGKLPRAMASIAIARVALEGKAG